MSELLELPDHGDRDKEAVAAALAMGKRIKATQVQKGKAMKAKNGPLTAPLAPPAADLDPRRIGQLPPVDPID